MTKTNSLPEIDTPQVRSLIRLAIDEDSVLNDITSALTVPEAAKGSGRIVARENGVICGLPIIPMIVSEVGWPVTVSLNVLEGSRVKPEQCVAVVSGSARQILALERTILNFLQRLSGVATFTASVIEKSSGITVLDTRKTMPGWRQLDKYATKIGGARNHRFSLSDMILVKNNHIDLAGGVAPALESIAKGKPPHIKVEVEVRNIDELQAAIPFNPDIIMLDNMDDSQIRASLEILRSKKSKAEVEISGGVTLEKLASLRECGVLLVSMGSLTTRAPNLDISMRI